MMGNHRLLLHVQRGMCICFIYLFALVLMLRLKIVMVCQLYTLQQLWGMRTVVRCCWSMVLR